MENFLDFYFNGKYECASCEDCNGPLLGHMKAKCFKIGYGDEEVKKFVGIRPDLRKAGWYPTAEKLCLLDGSLEWAEDQICAPGMVILKILSQTVPVLYIKILHIFL